MTVFTPEAIAPIIEDLTLTCRDTADFLGEMSFRGLEYEASVYVADRFGKSWHVAEQNWEAAGNCRDTEKHAISLLQNAGVTIE